MKSKKVAQPITDDERADYRSVGRLHREILLELLARNRGASGANRIRQSSARLRESGRLSAEEDHAFGEIADLLKDARQAQGNLDRLREVATTLLDGPSPSDDAVGAASILLEDLQLTDDIIAGRLPIAKTGRPEDIIIAVAEAYVGDVSTWLETGGWPPISYTTRTLMSAAASMDGFVHGLYI